MATPSSCLRPAIATIRSATGAATATTGVGLSAVAHGTCASIAMAPASTATIAGSAGVFAPSKRGNEHLFKPPRRHGRGFGNLWLHANGQ